MKIKKDGKVINLTESDLKKITKKVMVEQFYSDDQGMSVHEFIGNIVDELLGFIPEGEKEELISDIMRDMKKMIYSYLNEY